MRQSRLPIPDISDVPSENMKDSLRTDTCIGENDVNGLADFAAAARPGADEVRVLAACFMKLVTGQSLALWDQGAPHVIVDARLRSGRSRKLKGWLLGDIYGSIGFRLDRHRTSVMADR